MPTGIDHDGYQPEHLSYSTMDGLRFCGKRFQLTKVFGLEQRPLVAGLGGNAVHTATELYDLESYPLALTENEVNDLFKIGWERNLAEYQRRSPSFNPDEYAVTGRAPAKYGGKRTIQWWLDHGPGMVQAWIDWRRESNFEVWETAVSQEAPVPVPAIELELKVDIGGITQLMFIDRVMVNPAGQLLVLDIKTGRLPEVPEQLGLYATGLELKYGEFYRPDFGYFWSPDKGLSKPYELSRYTEKWFSDLGHMTVAGINAGYFPAKPANACKNWCAVAQYCEAVGGTLPALFQTRV